MDPEAATKPINTTSEDTPQTPPDVHDNPAFETEEGVTYTEIEQTNETSKDAKDTNTPKSDKQSESPSGSVNSTKSVDSGVGLATVGTLPSESNC